MMVRMYPCGFPWLLNLEGGEGAIKAAERKRTR
jgi:hypothetical protein